jgi:transcriptional regulator
MHAPPHFRMDDQSDMAAFIEARHFATLVVAGPNGPQAAHIPMILNRDDTGKLVTLEGHVARSNPVAAIAATPVRALAIFNGADAYVTREHGKVVPTWNYIAVQVAGEVQAFSDAAALRRQVERLTDMMEQHDPAPWAVSDAPEDYLARMITGITGLGLSIDSIEGSRKLSQNRAEADRAAVLDGFVRSTDPSARELAAEMQKKKA